MVQALGRVRSVFGWLSISTGCLFFKEADNKREAMLMLILFFFLSQNLHETISWYIVAKQVKGCVCNKNGSTSKAMRGRAVFSWVSSSRQQSCFLKPWWGIRHSTPPQGVFSLLFYSLENNKHVLSWCRFVFTIRRTVVRSFCFHPCLALCGWVCFVLFFF